MHLLDVILLAPVESHLPDYHKIASEALFNKLNV